MKRNTLKLSTAATALWAASLIGGATAHATEFYLRAGAVTNAMPDGRQVVMWGFARDSAFGVRDGTVKVPGPVLMVSPGQTTLTIHLDNDLPEPVSVVIPGQVSAEAPVPVRAVNGRAMSFTHETAPGNAAPVDYTWNQLTPGTYLYQSGSHVSVQVQMGLYGCLKHDVAHRVAYSGVSYNSEVTLLFGEIDPALHDAVATGNYGTNKAMTSTVNYAPKYFLINGQSYTNGLPPIHAGQSGGSILLRFLNAGLKSHVPIVNGSYLRLVAEDGFLSPYPKDQYSVFLGAGKTMDALFTSSVTNTFALYDRTLNLVNGTNSPGGMLAYLTVGNPTPPAVLYWQLPSGEALRWVMNTNGTYTSYNYIYSLPTTWQIRGTADIDGDGIDDILWQLPSGQALCWFMNTNGTYRSYAYMYNLPTTWQIRGAGDIDGDGVTDVLWQLPSGEALRWVMNTNGTYASFNYIYNLPTTWQIRAVTDIDGDGIDDIIWQLPSGQALCWFMNTNGTYRSYAYMYNLPTTWQIRAAGDIDGDGVTDVLWQLPSGEALRWVMNTNGTYASFNYIYNLPTTWRIRAVGN